MKQQALVSVIIPAYNAARHITEALESVFAQRFSDYEIIVVNDGSPDSAELERVLEPYRSGITYVVQQNRGPGGARNTGVRTSRAEFVAFLDSDDSWMPDFLHVQVASLRADPDLDLVYTNSVLVGDTPYAGRTCMEWNPSRGEVSFESLARGDCTVFTSCVVARREALVAAGLFDEQMHHAEDWDLWLRLLNRGAKVSYNRDVHGCRQLRADSLSGEGKRMFLGRIAVCEKLMQSRLLTADRKALLGAQVEKAQASMLLSDAKEHFVQGDYERARAKLHRANQISFNVKLWAVTLGLTVAPNFLRALYRARA